MSAAGALGRPAVEVRRATAVDLKEVGATLALAFADDPVMAWLMTIDRRRAKLLRRFMTLRARQLHRQDEVWTTAGREGAALWAQPGEWHEPVREVLQMIRVLLPDVLAHLPRSLRGLEEVESHHPQEPEHYYLAVLGTHPQHQGRGIGSKLLAPVLEECDANGIGAYLESSKERNIAFYARHGFKVTGEVRLPGGPLVWPMWRDPR